MENVTSEDIQADRERQKFYLRAVFVITWVTLLVMLIITLTPLVNAIPPTLRVVFRCLSPIVFPLTCAFLLIKGFRRI